MVKEERRKVENEENMEEQSLTSKETRPLGTIVPSVAISPSQTNNQDTLLINTSEVEA